MNSALFVHMMNGLRKRAVYQSPLRLLILLAVTIFAAEAIIMFFLRILAFPRWVEDLLDSFSLSIVMFPTLYFFVFRPSKLYISEIKQGEESLKQSEEKYRLLVENIPAVAYIGDAEGKTIFITPNVEKVYGYTPEEIYSGGSDIWFGRIHPEDLEYVKKEYGLFFKENKPLDVEYRILRKDGEWIWLHDRVISSHQEKGVFYIYGLFSDVSERKKAEECLEKQRQELEIILDSSPVIIFYKDKGGRFLRVNKAFAEALQIPKERFLGRTVFDLYPANIAQGMTKDDQEVLESGRPKINIVEQYESASGIRWVQTDKVPIFSADGITVGLIGFAQDITARKKAEDKLKKAYQELETAQEASLNIMEDLEKKNDEAEASLKEIARVNKELSDFAYIVSHDLKAPLRVIGTITGWLAEDYKDKLDDAGKEQLSVLLQKTKKMHDMIEGILQYSRVGRIKGTPESIDTGKVAEQVREALAPPANIQINIYEPMPTLTIDPVQINQIIQNLISNAIKYMDKPEGIIEVGCREAGEFWEFYVKDNGPGIEERHFERIFQIFQTLKARDEFESTGIGLTIVKKIIEQNNGRIWVESEIGKGSTFKFTIPKKV